MTNSLISNIGNISPIPNFANNKVEDTNVQSHFEDFLLKAINENAANMDRDQNANNVSNNLDSISNDKNFLDKQGNETSIEENENKSDESAKNSDDKNSELDKNTNNKF